MTAENPHFVLFLNGVRHSIGDPAAWTSRAKRHILLRHPGLANDAFEYRAAATLRWATIGKWTEALADLVIDLQSHYRISIVAHSNGAELTGRILRSPFVSLHQVHLIAAACESDFDRNGLNHAITDGRVRYVYAYCSDRDRVLRHFAGFSRILRPIGLGYGRLGYLGPANRSFRARQRSHAWWRPFRHDGFINKDNLPRTLDHIVRALDDPDPANLEEPWPKPSEH